MKKQDNIDTNFEMEEALYRSMIDEGFDGIFVQKGAKIIFANKRLNEMLGYTEGELIGKDHWIVYHPEDQIITRQRAKARMRGDKPPTRYEVKLQCKDGSWFYGEIDAHVIQFKGEVGIQVWIRDISGRKELEKSLKQSESLLSTMFNSITFPVHVIDREFRVILTNRNLLDLTGHTQEEIVGKHCYQVYQGRDTRCDFCLTREVFRTGKPFTSEITLPSKDGTIQYFEVASFPMFDEKGDVFQAIELTVDITERKKAERALLESEAQKKAILDGSIDRIRLVDRDMRIIWANKTTAREVKKAPEDLVGHKCYKYFLGRDIPCPGCPTAKALESGETEHEIIHHMGTRDIRGESYWDSYAVPIKSNGDHVSQVIQIARNITEVLKSQEKLRESEQRYRIVFENTGTATVMMEHDMTISMSNSQFVTLSGYSRKEIQGKMKWTEFVVKEDLEKMMEYHIKRRKGDQKVPTQYEFRFIDRKGNVKYVVNNVILIPGTKKTIASLTDITPQIRDHEALRESEEKYRTLFETSIDAIYITTREGIFADVNQSFLDLFGYTAEEIKGMNSRVFYANPDDRLSFIEAIEKNGSVKNYNVRLRKKDGSEIECVISAVVRSDPRGVPLGYQGVIRDTTRQKKAEAEQKKLESQLLHAQKMEAIGTLAGGIAHDFNNILQAISGYSQILMMGREPGETDYERLKAIEKASFRGSDLTSQLLLFSRKGEIKLRPINLNQELMQFFKMLERTIPKMISIESNLENDLHLINGDPSQLEQIIMNLALNARDAMPEGGILSFETKNVFLDDDYCNTHLGASRGNYVLLGVSDTGSGMDKDTVEHVFEPFFTTKARGKGTGLGLATVYGIVKRHDGYIMCYSEKGEGTTFKIYLPVLEEEDTMTIEPESPLEDIKGGNETILVVDDEETLLEIAKEMLKNFGYTVLTAQDGKSALEIYRNRKDAIDLTILDLIMPGMGGKRCLGEILKINPEATVIIASGYSANGHAQDALMEGAKGFVGKPYNIKKMLKAIRDVLDRKQKF